MRDARIVMGYVDAKGTATIRDQEGRFIKSLIGIPGKGYLDLLDEVATLIGEEVDGLGFLDEGFFNAIGYDLRFNTEVDVDYKWNIDNIGFSGGLGVMWHVSPLISLVGEVKGVGYNMSTKGYQLEFGELELDLFGNRNVLVLDENGGILNGPDGEVLITREELAWLYEVEHTKVITEESNNILYNPDTFNPSQPSEKHSIRQSFFAAMFNVSLHINFDRKTKRNKHEITE